MEPDLQPTEGFDVPAGVTGPVSKWMIATVVVSSAFVLFALIG